ncbi:Oidioi.mRNA.OKI2018_I69.XSR.g16393.t1.cds [Oikopleura dioica]|uniref:Oidioi.mRNA.OKI2018_I69.XSR.g16393.t1.cds n=1 Tax=Oikopleura dioica TaxID=34765 RepID=A0ABN7SFY8_OIKDI|nr:Oidioi.mRNA.OKI2018_I69.XSR.g16393.t1.cds [Oikopleura dioica]
MDRYLKRRSKVLGDCPKIANPTTSDSGVKNLNTKTNTNASLATDDTFDEELDIDVEELDRVMNENKGPADEGFDGTRVANDDDFNLRFSSQTTTTIEPPQRVVEGNFTLRWEGSPDDSQTSAGNNDQNEEAFSEEINTTNSKSPKKRRSHEPASIIDFLYEDERRKIAEHVARTKNQNDAVPIQTQTVQNIVENTPENVLRPPRPVHSQMPRPGKAARSSSLSESILRPRDSTVCGLGNSKDNGSRGVTSLLNELNSSTTIEKTNRSDDESVTNANSTSSTTQVAEQNHSTITPTVNPANPELNVPVISSSAREEERPVVNSADADPVFRVPAVPPRRHESSSGTKGRSSEETTSAHPNSTSSSSNAKSSGVGRTITTSSTRTSSYGTPTPQSQKSVCIYRSKNSLAVAVFDEERQTILWSENKLQAIAKNDQVDNLLLPLLFEHEPRFLVVCGNKEDALLSALLKVSKERFAAADYRPPQLIRLDNSEFFAPKCQARIREHED